jgi:enoyl-CoA hydratase/carnithine racemase
MEYSQILYDVTDAVATITLNRPDKMNAFTGTMMREVIDAFDQVDADDGVRAVIVTGAGRAFCAGADLSGGGDTFADGGSDVVADPGIPRDGGGMTALRIYECTKPVIGAINGAAVGVGVTMTLPMDFRLAADTAKFGFVFTRRGMMPEFAAHLLVQRVVGLSNAADLLMSGRIFLGSEAAKLGIASQAVPPENVLEVALAKAKEYELTAPVSVAITKRLLWEGLDSSIEGMLAKENPLFDWIGNQPDAKEGIMSFVEKRNPEWKMSVSRDMPEEL